MRYYSKQIPKNKKILKSVNFQFYFQQNNEAHSVSDILSYKIRSVRSVSPSLQRVIPSPPPLAAKNFYQLNLKSFCSLHSQFQNCLKNFGRASRRQVNCQFLPKKLLYLQKNILKTLQGGKQYFIYGSQHTSCLSSCHFPIHLFHLIPII